MGSMPTPVELSSGPRLPSLLGSVLTSRLTRLASELESRHGAAGDAASRKEAMIVRVARKLAESGGDLSQLDRREKRATLDAFWRQELWPAQAGDFDNWLRWAETEWRPRIAETRICSALLRNFDLQNPATDHFALWLTTRQNQLWGRFGDFARRWRLAEGDAAENAGRKLAADDMSFVRDIAKSVQTKVALHGSGFLIAVIAAYTCHSAQRTDAQAWVGAEDLLDLLGPRGFARACGPQATRMVTRNALVCALVEWAARLATAPAIARALDLCFRLAGDPRLTMEEWRDIPEDCVAQVEKWLVERTVTAAFQIVEELKTDDPSALQKRKDFWFAYLPYATRARLIGAPKAHRVAARLGEPCGALKTYLSDHCGFLLELQGQTGRRLRVIELNNLAQTMFWPEGRPNAPDFVQTAHDGSVLRANCGQLFSHLPADTWTSNFAELIEMQTGIDDCTQI